MKETFTVDTESISELKTLIRKLVKKKKRLEGLTSTDKAARVAKKNRDEKRYSKYKKWLSECKQEEGKHYVYAHCDPSQPLNVSKSARDLLAAEFGLTHRPFYIGKGKDDRCFNTKRNDSYRKKKTSILKSGEEIQIVKIKEGLSDESSKLVESTFIKIFGIMAVSNFNWLVNLAE